MKMLTDIEIAQNHKIIPIEEIAKKAGICNDALEPYALVVWLAYWIDILLSALVIQIIPTMISIYTNINTTYNNIPNQLA